MPTQRTTHRGFVVAAVMLSSFMVAIEATIVSTAMPQIVGLLGGLNLYSWVFSAFLLTQTAATVVFGKLADVYGRRPTLIAGITLFLLASVLCGLAPSMPWLIGFRLLQGIGSGAIMPITVTIIGDLYTAEERGKVQGWLASVWGVSAVLGPLAGGLIVQHLSWSWVFWINIPIGLAAIAVFLAYLHEASVGEPRPIDRLGAVLFTIAIAALMLALTESSGADFAELASFVAVFAASAGWFVWHERRVAEPMVDFRLWAHRPIFVANGGALIAGAALMGLTTFLPIFVQAVLHRSALVAGFTLTAVVMGWPIAATATPRIYGRFGLRFTFRLGAALLPIGAVAFASLGPGSHPAVAALGSFIMGLGMGALSTAAIVLVQEIVPWSQRGSATASNIFARNLGSTLGAAVLGAVFNAGLAEVGRQRGAALSSTELRRLLDGTGSADPAVLAAIASSLGAVFWAVLAMAVLGVAVSVFLPRIDLIRREPVAPAPVPPSR